MFKNKKKQIIKLDEVLQTSLLKSFDYRVLHGLLFQLTQKKPYNQAILDFLRVNEHLVDIHDDLYDYEKDINKNSFNIYRMFVYIEHDNAPLKMVAHISDYENQYAQLSHNIPHDILTKFESREKEAMNEHGGNKWIIPSPIYEV